MMGLLAVVIFLSIGGSASGAEEFLGAPLPPGGKVLSKTERKLELQCSASHDEIVEFYRQRLSGYKDIRYRDWKEEAYIEDHGALPWHSIRISKGSSETRGTITRDSWTWILGTLTLRFVGVFVVLLFLYAGMWLAGKIISRLAPPSGGT